MWSWRPLQRWHGPRHNHWQRRNHSRAAQARLERDRRASLDLHPGPTITGATLRGQLL